MEKKKPVGRPPLGDQKTKPINVRIDPELHAWLKQYAADTNQTLTDAVENAMKAFRTLTATQASWNPVKPK